MRKALLAMLLAAPMLLIAKKDPKYPTSNIPKEMLSKADAVLRTHSEDIVISENLHFTRHIHYAITILKESGKEKATFIQGYNKLTSINNIEAIIYDAGGKIIKKIKNDDIEDYSAVDGAALYSDSRIKIIDPKQSQYPFTVEYSFDEKCKTLYYLPSFSIYPDFNTSVEKTSFSIETPVSYNLRYKEKNKAPNAIIEENGDLKRYKWSLTNQKAVATEPLAPSQMLYLPIVEIHPSKVSLDGYEGDLSTWSDFGKFYSLVNEGKETLPIETIEKVKSSLSEEMTDREKIATIYQYSQKKNRYILIMEGIGGLQPFDAKTVDENSYGDCKALSNYTVALLNACGYNAYYSIIKAGSSQIYIDESFAGDYFNHVIACVELNGETIWLECTSPYSPVGYMGDFTDDRAVIKVKPEGGELAHTPAYTKEENLIKTEATFKLTSEGHALAEAHIYYHGSNYSDEIGLTLVDEEDRKKKIVEEIQCPNVNLKQYSIETIKEQKPELTKNISFETINLASTSGGKIYLTLNALNRNEATLPFSRNRKAPFQYPREYGEEDRVQFQLPEGVTTQAIPESVTIESEFGNYKTTVEEKDGVIHYYRLFQIYKGLYEKEKYNEFVEFLEKVTQADKAKAILTS